MPGFSRIKKVTDPLDDMAKARLIGREIFPPGSATSGSEHSAYADANFSSTSLSELFFGFSVDDSVESSPEIDDRCLDDSDLLTHGSVEANIDLIDRILQDQTDLFKSELEYHVTMAVNIFESREQIKRRNVMLYLRNRGYNAAICKTKWQSSGGVTSGNHEFIDVVRAESPSTRYLIDLNFAAEFEIARRTDSYARLLQQLPRVFVGTVEELKTILRAVSDAATTSLKCRKLTVPPWRKYRFFKNKWLGQYRRTVNLLPTSLSSTSPETEINGVKWRVVGFNAAVKTWLPTAAGSG